MARRRGIFGENKVHFQSVGGDIVGNQFAVVLLGDVFGNRQAQTGTVLSVAAVGAVKRGEDVRQLLGFDARPVVDNHDVDVAAVFVQDNADGAALRAVFHGVANHVIQRAIQIAFVGF